MTPPGDIQFYLGELQARLGPIWAANWSENRLEVLIGWVKVADPVRFLHSVNMQGEPVAEWKLKKKKPTHLLIRS